MSYYWKKALLAISVGATVLISSCEKKSSGDKPLPETFNPSVIVGSDNQFVYAYDPKDGDKHWELFLDVQIKASPVLLDTCVYIAGMNGSLYKIDAKRGTLISTIHFPNATIVGTPVVHDKLIFVPATNDTLYCIENDGIKWRYGVGGDLVSSPTILDKEFVVFGSLDGKMYCLRALDGQWKWTYDAGAGNEWHSSPVASGKFIFAGNKDKKLYKLNAADGVFKWSFPTGEPIYSSPFVYGGSVLVGSDDSKLYCVDSATGLHRWLEPFKTGDRIRSSPTAVNNMVYVGSYDYYIYGVSILDGTVKQKYKTYGLVKSSPMVYDGMLYCGSHDKFLYALDLTTFRPRWVQSVNGVIECSPMLDDLMGKSYHSSVSGMQ
jgi:outer membrane protein assembly factor BamB